MLSGAQKEGDHSEETLTNLNELNLIGLFEEIKSH